MEGEQPPNNPHLDAALAAGQEADAIAEREAQAAWAEMQLLKYDADQRFKHRAESKRAALNNPSRVKRRRVGGSQEYDYDRGPGYPRAEGESNRVPSLQWLARVAVDEDRAESYAASPYLLDDNDPDFDQDVEDDLIMNLGLPDEVMHSITSASRGGQIWTIVPPNIKLRRSGTAELPDLPDGAVVDRVEGYRTAWTMAQDPDNPSLGHFNNFHGTADVTPQLWEGQDEEAIERRARQYPSDDPFWMHRCTIS